MERDAGLNFMSISSRPATGGNGISVSCGWLFGCLWLVENREGNLVIDNNDALDTAIPGTRDASDLSYGFHLYLW